MQVFLEFLTAAVIWIAAAVLSQFGVDIDLREQGARQERVVERVRAAEPKPVASHAGCPEEARLRKAGAVRADAA